MKKILILFCIITFFVACDNTNDPESNGVVKILITDAPFPAEFVKKAEVTILRVDLKHSGESDTSQFVTIADEAKLFDLVQLRNGLTELFGEAEIEPGTYNELRMIAGDASIELTDGRVFDLKIPSGSSSGIKIKIRPTLEVSSGQTAELLIDFDLARSFVVKGGGKKSEEIKGFSFKPVIRAVNNTASGKLEGTVADDSSKVVDTAMVWISEQDSVLSTTFTDSLGHYMLIGLPEGIYNLYATKEGYDTAKVLNFQIIQGETKIQNFVITKQ